ncbi:hypothetical protein Gohar_018328, partial [Gossypium harknessii]|nr:hypothetical protein [Gossypium harknessii]
QNIRHFRLQQLLPASAVSLKKRGVALNVVYHVCMFISLFSSSFLVYFGCRGQWGCYRIPSTVKSSCSMPVQKLLSHVIGIIRVLFSRKEESVLERWLAYLLLNGKGRLRRASTRDCQESLKSIVVKPPLSLSKLQDQEAAEEAEKSAA